METGLTFTKLTRTGLPDHQLFCFSLFFVLLLFWSHVTDWTKH